MRLLTIVEQLNLKTMVDGVADREVTGVYCSDLLSDVLKNAKAGMLWITNLNHQNCIGVASLLELSGVIIAGGIAPDDNAVEKAVIANIPLFTSEKSVFELAGKLWEMGLRG